MNIYQVKTMHGEHLDDEQFFSTFDLATDYKERMENEVIEAIPWFGESYSVYLNVISVEDEPLPLKFRIPDELPSFINEDRLCVKR